MKNNIKSKMISELRNTAMKFHGYGSLREKLKAVVIENMGDDWYTDTDYSLDGLIADVEIRDSYIERLKDQIQSMKSCENCEHGYYHNRFLKCDSDNEDECMESDNKEFWRLMDELKA